MKFKIVNESLHTVNIDDDFINTYKDQFQLLNDADENEFGTAWFDDDQLIGYCLVNEWGWLTALEVSEQYRNQGIGQMILDYAIDKYHINRLGVYKDNLPAIHLYKKNGFFEVPSYVVNGSNQDNMLFMSNDDTLK